MGNSLVFREFVLLLQPAVIGIHFWGFIPPIYYGDSISTLTLGMEQAAGEAFPLLFFLTCWLLF